MADHNAHLAAPSARTPTHPNHAYNPHRSTPAETPRPETPVSLPSPPKRQKLVKDAAQFTRGAVTGPNNYPPYESSAYNDNVTAELDRELVRQHKLHKITPSALVGDKISDFPRHIPYSSEKKSFFSRAGRDTFHGMCL